METIRKNIITVVMVLIGFTGFSQSMDALQAAFSKSYEAENAKKYAIAISELKAGYDADNYVINIRLGWLSYLAKQYIESINYYQKAIALKPYAIEARFGCVKPLSIISNERVLFIAFMPFDPSDSKVDCCMAKLLGYMVVFG